MSDFSSNYEVLIQGRLDTTSVENKLKTLENTKIAFKNYAFDTSGLANKIQSELDKHKFTLQLKDIQISNLSNQFVKSGLEAGNQFASGFNNGVRSISTTANNADNTIQHMKQTLASMKFDRSSIETVTKDLSTMNIEISNISTRIGRNGLNVTIRGIDELGRAVTIVKQFDHESGQIVSVGKTIAQSFDTSADAAKRYQTEVRELAKAEREAFKEQQTFTKSQKLSNDISVWMNENKKAAERYGDVLRDLQNKLKYNSDTSELNKASAEFAKIKSEAKAAGLTVNVFNKNLKQTVLQVLGLGSSVMILQTAIRVFKALYKNVYEIDTAMTNLYKVTDETSSKYQQFLNNANKSAQELGKTVSSLIEQTATWAKLGYSIDDAANLAKLSSVYANVAEIDDGTAVSDMVTAMKAFNIEAKDAITIIDPLNELGNTFATSAGDLGSGLTRAASAMKLAGSDIYETLAMITGGAEITQNASEFGNALKIASMRIRGMKGELEELGEEVDENVDSISKVQTQILNLTKGKVNIFDDLGEFRSYYEIMKDISEVYNDLASTDQAALMETLFGKQRGNQGAALIQAFQSGQIEKAYETAKNSAGSAMAEQEKWMESLEAKTQQFKASIESLSNTVLNSDFLKGAIDSGTTFINILTAIVDKFGVFNTVAVSGGIVAFIKSIS